MKKTLVILDEKEPELLALSKQLPELFAKGREQCGFLEKRAKMIEAEIEKERLTLWGRVEQICKDRGWIPQNYTSGSGSFLTFDGNALTFSQGQEAQNEMMAESLAKAVVEGGGMGLGKLLMGLGLIKEKVEVEKPKGDT